ncbi:retrovirus-related pol polyprotein from transposon 297 [Plakobranchus ocellatus]|uniref:Retrovirus-related pol polyprotein from transposon 297 n=1 Tax=Plakobranchus ocellatus TaxID=259542 RepID=A0AAV4A7U0_9GAST|nr:retrovirus-related pol polyprotein from transposon 297 [Plakobranchus ocellatus]
MVALKTVASAYMDARPNKSFYRKRSISFAAKSEPYRSTVRVAERKDDSRPHVGGGRSNYFSKGHRSPSRQSSATRSPSRDRNSSNVADKNIGQGRLRPSSGSVSSNITCFQCGGRGHFRRECPSRPKEANFASSVPDSPSHSCECPSRPKEANVAFSVPELPYHCCAAKMDCNPRGKLKIESCKVFDRVSTLLRDSGCNMETFIVRSDASDFGIGAVLLQDRDGTLMPCRYASRKLLPRECKYSAIEREALALVFAVTQFQRYLIFKHFVLQTDHKPLAYLRTGSPKNARLIRWALALREFSSQVVHIPGSENVHADMLSRLC